MIKRIIFILSFIILTVSCEYKPASSAVFYNGERLTALNENARIGFISGRDRNAFFIFSEPQIESIKKYRKEHRGASIKLTFALKEDKNGMAAEDEVCYGFLYDEDFTPESKLIHERNGRVFTQFRTVRDMKEFNISLCIPDSRIPRGIAVTSRTPIFIRNCSVCEKICGWSRNDEGLPWFASSEAGDRLELNFLSCRFRDMTGGDRLNKSNMLTVSLFDARFIKGGTGKYTEQNTMEFSTGGDSFSIRIASQNLPKVFHESSLLGGWNDAVLTKNADAVQSIFFSAEDKPVSASPYPLVPVSTDLGLIIEWKQDKWRCSDYGLYEWDLFPGVLIFDFADYRIQNEFFTRMAFFAEKAGYKGTLVDDTFVETKHGYNAHDYKAKDLADFFNLVSSMRFKLNSREKLLREILLANGIITAGDDGIYRPGKGCVISICRESPKSLRYQFIAHESWHGIFFTDEEFRNFTAGLYEAFPSKAMEFIQTYWEFASGLGYDRNDSYLMKNEFMAYIMQQGVSAVQSYFTGLAGRNAVKDHCPELGNYIRKTEAEDFKKAAEAFNDYAYERWGLAAGRVQLVTRTSRNGN